MQDNIARGDIFYVHKESVVGSEQMAGRPAIIVSNDACNKTSETVEVVYLTTRHKTMLPTHVTINSSARTSTALCEQITTVSVDRLGDPCGHLTEKEIEELDEALRVSLGLKKLQQALGLNLNTPHSNIELIQQLAAVIAERDVYKNLYTELLGRMMQER